jgi:hypothetical protein
LFRLTELEYLNERIRAEEALASSATLPRVSAIHAELAERYRRRRHETQRALSLKLRRRYPLQLRRA